MRHRKIVFFGIICCAIIFSCNKSRLDQPALGQLDETALANKHGVEGLLIGAYALLDGVSDDESYDPNLGPIGGGGWLASASNWVYGSICGSEAYKGSDPGDQLEITNLETFFEVDPNNSYLNEKWRAVYAGIARANAVLRVMRKAADMTPADTTEVRAEAVFLRAHYHFEAAKMWNKVPFVDENVTYDAGNYYLDNDSTIWDHIENDFKYAIANLPPTQHAIGRVNKYAAEAFLAKAYMFEHKYADARPLLEDLIQNGETAGGLKYKLAEKYGANFNVEFENKEEAVFSVQASVNDGATSWGASGYNGNIGDVLNFPYPNGGSAPGGCCGFFSPSQWLVNHFKTDPITGLPDLDHFNDENLKNDDGYAADSVFTPYSGTLDPRLDWTVGRRGVPYLDWGPEPGERWIRFKEYGPYTPKKNSFSHLQYDNFTDPGFWSSGGQATANNVNLIRFADILLWAAEAEIEDGDLEKARGYVNMVRERANNQSGWVKNEDNIPNAKAVTNSQIEFDAINDPSFTKIQPFEWVVRTDLNQTWVLLTIKANKTKVWNAYAVPSYKVGIYQNTWTDIEFAKKAVRFERVLELGMEGHRFFDLQRYSVDPIAHLNNGYMADEINKYFLKEKTLRPHLNQAQFTENKNEYFPIPQHQIDLSIDKNGVKHLKQNPGY